MIWYRIAIRRGGFALVTLFHIAIATILSLHSAMAQASSGQNALWLEASRDSSDSTDFSLNLNKTLNRKDTLLLKLGSSRLASSQETFDATNWALGLNHKLSDKFDFTLRYEFWGKTNDLETGMVESELNWHNGNWSYQLIPGYRDIRLFLNPSLGITAAVELNSTHLGIAAQYYGMDNWELAFATYFYDYSKDPKRLNSRLAAILLSGKALTLASGFEDHNASIEITRLFNNSSLGLYYSNSKSAVDNTRSEIIALKTYLFNFKPYTIALEAGSLQSEVDEAGSYVTLGVGYRW